MNCINFFEGDLAEKISCSQANRNTTLFFLHIPKTAGTSAQRDLNYAFPEGIHIPQESKEHHWNATLEKLALGPVSLIRGHLTSEHLRQVQDRVPSVHAITYLRHPTDRLISNFLWRHANHRNSPQKFASPGSFEEFCKLKSSNHMSDLLVGPCESTDEAMDKLKNRFWFVGLTEYYHVCQAILLNLLGSSYRIRKRQNITQSQPAERELITQQGLEIAHAGMEIDFAIYHFFHQQWSAKINDAIEFTMRVASQPNLKRPQQPKSEKLQAA